MPSLSVIVPTIGRGTLCNTLASFAPDLGKEDHVYVVSDGVRPGVGLLVDYFQAFYPGHWHYKRSKQTGCWGHAHRNQILDEVGTDYVWTIDDDDVAAPGALEAFREATDPWVIYRMEFGDAHPARRIVCWRNKHLQYGDIGTPMILAKPCSARFGTYYEGDWGYAQNLQAIYGDPAWDERIVAIIRPEEVDGS